MKQPKKHVLIIEDDPLQAEALGEALRGAGQAVEVATRGLEGLDKARRQPPDLVICDVNLPDIDGPEVARRMRSDPRLRSARMLALSVYASSEDEQRSLEAGFDAHLAKPPSFEELEAEIARVPSLHER